MGKVFVDFIKRLFGGATPGVGAQDVQLWLQATQPQPLVLDVRQPDEYRAGHIRGAQLIPLSELQQRVGELPRDRKIVCVCRSGNRSSNATRLLAPLGFDVVNMDGGMIAWQRAGLPVKQGNGR